MPEEVTAAADMNRPSHTGPIVSPPTASHGLVMSDPACSPADGTELKFSAVLLTMPNHSGVHHLLSHGATHGVLLSLMFGDHLQQSMEGSAVLVDAGVALCAHHVVGPQLKELMAVRIAPIAVAFTAGGLQLWAIRKYTHVTGTDVAILGLTACSALAPDGEYHQASISTRLPAIGEELKILGVRAAQPSFPKIGNMTAATAAVLMCTGRVTQRYPRGRDRVMLPGPCIEIDCPSWGGMSGGPVFDERGWLIGVLSSSVSAEDDEGPSFVSLVTPAIAVEFEGGWPERAFEGRRRLLYSSTCRIERPEAIRLFSDLQSQLEIVQVDSWE